MFFPKRSKLKAARGMHAESKLLKSHGPDENLPLLADVHGELAKMRQLQPMISILIRSTSVTHNGRAMYSGRRLDAVCCLLI